MTFPTQKPLEPEPKKRHSKSKMISARDKLMIARYKKDRFKCRSLKLL